MGGWCYLKRKKRPRWKAVYKKMGLIMVSAGVVSVLVFLMDGRQALPSDEDGASVVKRNGYGEGERTEELQVQIGDTNEKYTVTIGERKYSEEELQELFADAADTLERLVLGENKSLDEVRKNLNLVGMIPETGIRVSWELDNYDVLDLQGVIKADSLTEEGTLVRLKALLTYGEEKMEHSFYARLYPPRLTRGERLLASLEKEVRRLDAKTQTEVVMKLPDSVDGQPVRWGYLRNLRAAGVMLLGVVLSLLLYISQKEKEKEGKKRRDMQMTLDYPQLVSTFTLFLGAGMPARGVWYRMAEHYEGRKAENGRREVYEEMVRSMHEMKGGANEGECYERFGERCGLPIYRKFAALLSQNLRKGTKGLALILKQEADNAFEERKSLAKKLGEEAGTKVLIPMFLMLAVVLVIIVVPAFLSMGF